MLIDTNLRRAGGHQEALNCALAKGQKAEAEFRVPFCPRSFDRAVMVTGRGVFRFGHGGPGA